jgi:Ca-activated chloride channel family protein
MTADIADADPAPAPCAPCASVRRAARRLAATALALLLAPGAALAQSPPAEETPPVREEVGELPDATALLDAIGTADVERCFTPVDFEGVDLVGQIPVDELPLGRRVVVALDSSGSMRGRVGGERKIDAAKRAASQFMRRLPDDVEAGLVLFGHRGNSREAGKAESCAGVEMPVALGPGRRDEIGRVIDGVRAAGWTPLASAIETAGGAFRPGEPAGDQVVYVISDGVETCGGDPVAAAGALANSDLRAVINIIGFDIEEKDRAQLAAVAEMGGGRFIEADDANALARIFNQTATNAARRSNALATATARKTNNLAKATGRKTNAMACVTGELTNETARMTSRLSNALARGDIDADLAEEVRAVVAARQAAARLRLEAYANDLDARTKSANAGIDAALEEALRPAR